jgi:hypothetical protein
MMNLIAIGIGAILIALSGVLTWNLKRKRDHADFVKRKQEEEAYLEEQRQRMKANRAVFMKEIEQIAKARHPGSTRHQRRAVASRYKQQIKSS